MVMSFDRSMLQLTDKVNHCINIPVKKSMLFSITQPTSPSSLHADRRDQVPEEVLQVVQDGLLDLLNVYMFNAFNFHHYKNPLASLDDSAQL